MKTVKPDSSLITLIHYINANAIEIFEENGKLAKKLNKNEGFSRSLSLSDLWR